MNNSEMSNQNVNINIIILLLMFYQRQRWGWWFYCILLTTWNNKQRSLKGRGWQKVSHKGVVWLGKSVFPQQLPFHLFLCVSWYYRITCKLIDCLFWILIKSLLILLWLFHSTQPTLKCLSEIKIKISFNVIRFRT